jgi:hypothetical protein
MAEKKDVNWFGICFFLIIGIAFLGSVINPSDPQKDYEEVIRLRGERLQYEAEQQRIKDNIEFHSNVEAIKIDMEKNPGRYR